ncbi:MAG: hypothetical protein DMG33_09635 [Acidobacteria bacterium]|nr:MAG: hypothetical protein DMG33_09635 [Acidobacteriota bacterium]
MTEREQFLGQIERLVGSHALHGSESLCKLLRYLAKHAVEHPGSTLKEYQIATEVFGRPSNFDPQLDSTVRVQAGRLRVKLAEYYASNGAEDTIVVELPKGAYALSFHHRGAPVGRTHGPRREIERDEGFERSGSRRWMIAAGALAVLLACAVAAIVVLLVARNTAEVGAAGHEDTAPAAFHVFWKRFVSGPEEPWVIFSNAAFIGRPETGMRYYEAAHDSRNAILDHYTGVGEVLAIHELDHVFGLLHHRIRVKRGSLFSLDDAKNNNLIFIGSPSENLTLLEIPGTQEFVFQRVVSGRRKGDLEIVNVHPQPDEPKQFLATPSGEPLTEDYAVVALIRGLNPAQSVLILAGTTTIGTQAAVEYVCRQDSIEKLLLRLSVSDTGELKPYEAVLQVKVTRGVPVETQLVALRKGAS